MARVSSRLLAAVSFAALLSACGSEPGSGSGGGAGGSGGASGSTSSSTSTLVEQASYCGPACTTAADCCNGAAGCPSDKYPNNWTCENGSCRVRCSGDADCPFFHGRCKSLFGLPSCVQECHDDTDCTLKCTGVADDGSKFCGCTPDSGCGLGGSCSPDRGLCVCTSSAECTSSQYPVCAPFD